MDSISIFRQCLMNKQIRRAAGSPRNPSLAKVR